MLKYEVTTPGYELLEKRGLDKRIEENWNNISMNLLPRGAILEEWELKELLEKDLPPERRKTIERWQKKLLNMNKSQMVFLWFQVL